MPLYAPLLLCLQLPHSPVPASVALTIHTPVLLNGTIITCSGHSQTLKLLPSEFIVIQTGLSLYFTEKKNISYINMQHRVIQSRSMLIILCIALFFLVAKTP